VGVYLREEVRTVADIEKVIRDLRYLKTFGIVSNNLQVTEIAQSAIELLKEYAEIKNGVEPELEGDPGNGYWWVCGECHGYLSTFDRFCKFCGRKVLRDARQTEEH